MDEPTKTVTSGTTSNVSVKYVSSCAHAELSYCPCCGAVFCKKCNAIWKPAEVTYPAWHYQPYYQPWPPYPYQPWQPYPYQPYQPWQPYPYQPYQPLWTCTVTSNTSPVQGTPNTAVDPKPPTVVG